MWSVIRRNRFGIIVFFFLFWMSYIFIKQKQQENEELLARYKEAQSTVPPEIYVNIKSLREQLESMKYENGIRTQELLQLRNQLKRNLPANMTEGHSLTLPSVYNFLPHLMGHKDALSPRVRISKDKKGVSLVLGIPTVPRTEQSYLLQTIISLLNGLNDEEKDDVLIIVMIADTDENSIKKIVGDIRERFPESLAAGMLEVISPPANYYPDLSHLRESFGDPIERVKWRTKQNLDYAFLMMYAQSRGIFYCQMEDDIVATQGYASTMKAFAFQQASNEWFMLEFSTLGFIGKLFRSQDIGTLIEFFLMFHKDKPIDWLLDHVLWVKVCNPEKDVKACNEAKSRLRIAFKPSLFQHVGKHSSLAGKKQNLIDKEFKKAPLFTAHLNPRAKIICTFEEYMHFRALGVYLGRNFFWTVTPKKGDQLRIIFDQPIKLKRFLFRTGNVEHPGDILANSSVEVLTLKMKMRRDDINKKEREWFSRGDDSYPDDDYQQIGLFDIAGVAEGEVSRTSALISEMRIKVLEDAKDNWAIISEINIETRKGS